MRRLLVLRHAKSDWPPGFSDIDRPLAERGQNDAPRMGAYMAREGLLPDRALVSGARRTRETFDLVASGLGETVPVTFEPSLHEAKLSTILKALATTPAGTKTLLLIGHNPGVTELVLRLVGSGDRYALSRLRGKFSTCGLAVLDLPGEEWGDLEPDSARLDRFVTPKSLGFAETDD